ncbi:MAG: class I SAM-dependent methyltransferase, partial [Halobacteriota archaeon]|nr:class I SAM-dependent methyltransferase [Halobacteriota archaeon]
GDFVMSASIHGATSFGIEPDKEWVKLSKLWLEASGISALLCMGAGEDLPFKDDVFDIVSCNFVLEHTKSPARVIEEMVRVLRPGGYCYLNVPNYIFPWEHHYKIIWSLILPKLLTRSYLQLRGRDPEYMDHIYPITSTFIFRTLGKLNIKIVANLVDDAIRDPDEIISGRWKILSHMIRTLHIPIQFINLISPVTSIIVTNSAQDSDIKSNRPYKNK